MSAWWCRCAFFGVELKVWQSDWSEAGQLVRSGNDFGLFTVEFELMVGVVVFPVCSVKEGDVGDFTGGSFDECGLVAVRVGVFGVLA